MRIYTKIVIDMETLKVIEAEWTDDYEGPVAECKGGSTTTNTVDYAYNARMAAISERQQRMAEEYFAFWKSDYKPLEREQIQANRQLIPFQTELEKQKILAESELIPDQVAFQKEMMAAGIEETRAAKPVLEEFYKQALEGVDVEGRVQAARSDVAQSFAESEQQLRRESGRLGLDPNDPRFKRALGVKGLEQAKATAGAMTTTRTAAEDEEFRRLAGATTTFKQGLPGLS